MLVVHGGLDYRVVDTQGICTFTALQRRGIPSKFLYFPDENHWVLKPPTASSGTTRCSAGSTSGRRSEPENYDGLRSAPGRGVRGSFWSAVRRRVAGSWGEDPCIAPNHRFEIEQGIPVKPWCVRPRRSAPFESGDSAPPPFPTLAGLNRGASSPHSKVRPGGTDAQGRRRRRRRLARQPDSTPNLEGDCPDCRALIPAQPAAVRPGGTDVQRTTPRRPEKRPGRGGLSGGQGFDGLELPLDGARLLGGVVDGVGSLLQLLLDLVDDPAELAELLS